MYAACAQVIERPRLGQRKEAAVEVEQQVVEGGEGSGKGWDEQPEDS